MPERLYWCLFLVLLFSVLVCSVATVNTAHTVELDLSIPGRTTTTTTTISMSTATTTGKKIALKWVRNLIGQRPWPADDPFLFVSYHGDWGWGFPNHPHYGFETITYALPDTQGFVDHCDSLGFHGRFGGGDVQWLTTGSGVAHAEVSVHSENDVKRTTGNQYSPQGNSMTGALFQIWLNLPEKSKSADPHYKMFWAQSMPTRIETTLLADGKSKAKTHVRVIAGVVGNTEGIAPPPNSWAADRKNGVSIVHLFLEPMAQFTFRRSHVDANSVVYYFGGKASGTVSVGSGVLSYGEGASCQEGSDSPLDVHLHNTGVYGAELLILEGRAIGEPVVQHGPFVATSREKLMGVFQKARQPDSVFNAWPWPEPKGGDHTGRKRFSETIVDGQKVLDEPDQEDFGWPAKNADRIQ